MPRRIHVRVRIRVRVRGIHRVVATSHRAMHAPDPPTCRRTHRCLNSTRSSSSSCTSASRPPFAPHAAPQASRWRVHACSSPLHSPASHLSSRTHTRRRTARSAPHAPTSGYSFYTGKGRAPCCSVGGCSEPAGSRASPKRMSRQFSSMPPTGAAPSRSLCLPTRVLSMRRPVGTTAGAAVQIVRRWTCRCGALIGQSSVYPPLHCPVP